MSNNAVESTLIGGAEEAKALSPQEKLMMQENAAGVALANQGKHAEALAIFNKTVAGTAEDAATLPDFLTNRANALIGLEKLDEAVADCTRAVQLNPKCIGAYVAHSKAAAYDGKLQQALDLLRQALSKDKENAGLQAVIRRLEAEQGFETAVAKNDPSRQKMNQYLDWLKGHGVESSKVKVRMADQRSTIVVATRDMQAGEQVLFVPADLILLPENAGDAPANSWLLWNAKVADKVPASQKDWVSIALYYLHEKNNSKGKHYKYFESLCQDNTNQVVRWEEAERDVLKGSWLGPAIAKMQKAVEDVYNVIQAEVPAETRGEFTLDEYKQAWAFADRHIIGIEKDGYQTRALVPFLNYVGYGSDTNIRFQFDAEKKGLQIIASRGIARGEEITLPAVSNTNDWFLMKRGEVRLATITRVPMEMALMDSDPMAQEKLKAMGGSANSSATFSLYANVNDRPFMSFVLFMRFKLMTGSPEVFANMNFFNNNGQFLGTPVASQGSKAESEVWKHIANMAYKKMQAYPVGLPDAQKAMQANSTPEGPHLTLASKVAHQYLITEQMTCREIFSMANLFIDLLSKSLEECYKFITANPSLAQWRDYIDSSILAGKAAEGQLVQDLAAARAAQAEANNGKGSLY